MTCEPSRGRAGFTLVEVLASLALVGVLLPTAMAGIMLAMGMGDRARHRTEAAMLARGKLDEMLVTGDWQSAQTTGDFGEEWPGYTWELNVTDWEESTCREVALTVHWTTRGHEYRTSLSTLACVEDQ
jgi:general secretion pathway protein I